MDSADAARAAAAVPDIPRDDSGLVFREPWEAQAFAMALALHELVRVTACPAWNGAVYGQHSCAEPLLKHN